MKDIELSAPVTTVGVFYNSKKPKLKEIVDFVISMSENEHCFRIVSRPQARGKMRKPETRYFSKPEFFFVPDYDEVLKAEIFVEASSEVFEVNENDYMSGK